MRKATELIATILFFLNISHCNAQSDSLLLTYQDYLQNIIRFHPIAEKAELKLKLAEAEQLGAKGNLDPVVTSGWNQKNFDDKLYYRQYQALLKFSTQLGIDVVGGYENTEGVFLNPENSTPDFGLWHMGIEANVLQGFIINERKTALEQAKVFQDLAKNEQQMILNDLVYNASSAYLLWQQYFHFGKVLEENISLASTYLQSTRQSFFNGEKIGLDTLEAFIWYQDALTFLQKNELSLIKARQNIENYLWYNEAPVTLQETTRPEDFTVKFLREAVDFESSALASHPIILASLNKLSLFEIEQKLKREKLKPKLKIKYNPLLSSSENSISPDYSIVDYKWGLDFSMPLLLRSERADIQKGEVKIRETELDIQNKRNELKNKIESSFQQQLVLQEQLNLLEQNVSNYKLLLDGENEKFNFGESSVFLLNKRQEKYIGGQLKLIEVHIKHQMEMLNFLYFSNQLIQ